MYGHLCIVFWNDIESLGEMVSLGKTPELYLEQVSLYYAYPSTAMYTQVSKRPSVPEKRRRCNSNRWKVALRQILLLGMLEQLVMKTYFKFQNLP